MAAFLLLLLGICSSLSTIAALTRLRHPSFLSFPFMMTSWLVGEYPFFHLAAQAASAAILVALGGLDSNIGVVGLALTLSSWLGLLAVRRVQEKARPTSEAALEEALGSRYLERLEPEHRERLRTDVASSVAWRPLHFDRTNIEIVRAIRYGDHPKRNVLDVYRPTDIDTAAPVILQIHGGAWVSGHKTQQAQPLLHRLVASGYVAVSINYRLGPAARFPAQIVDVKRAIAWVRGNIADHGGDPSTVILTGGSAGGHLASLAALAPDHAAWQPGFEGVDTSITACVPFYGPPDLRDEEHIRGRLASMEPFLARAVMPGPRRDDPELWDLASPIHHVRPDAPPFFVIQGANDVLVWKEEVRGFVRRLHEISDQPVVYWEIPGAQHAFDTFNSVRSAVAVDAVERFVGWVAASTLADQESPR